MKSSISHRRGLCVVPYVRLSFLLPSVKKKRGALCLAVQHLIEYNNNTIMASSIPSSSSLSPPSALPPPCVPTHRERKSTKKYTVKNNPYQDHLKALEGPNFVLTRARAANNTYIRKARAVFIKTKMAELHRLPEDARREAYDNIGRRSRQHSVLSM